MKTVTQMAFEWIFKEIFDSSWACILIVALEIVVEWAVESETMPLDILMSVALVNLAFKFIAKALVKEAAQVIDLMGEVDDPQEGSLWMSLLEKLVEVMLERALLDMI